MGDVNAVQYRTGDVVTLEHEDGSRLVRKVIFEDTGRPCVAGLTYSTWGMATLRIMGWRVTEHKPKINLPTQRGFYLDKDGDVWQIDDGNDLVMGNCDEAESLAFDPVDYAPFTRLVPESLENSGG